MTVPATGRIVNRIPRKPRNILRRSSASMKPLKRSFQSPLSSLIVSRSSLGLLLVVAGRLLLRRLRGGRRRRGGRAALVIGHVKPRPPENHPGAGSQEPVGLLAALRAGLGALVVHLLK